MTYGTRLDEALTHAGRSRKDLADVLGCTPQAIGIVITWNGEKDRKLATEAHAEAANFLKVDGYWLATGKGEMVLMSNQHAAHVNNAQEAINKIASMADCLQFLAAYLEALDAGDRAEALRMVARLGNEPEKHASVARSIEGMASAAFARAHQKAA